MLCAFHCFGIFLNSENLLPPAGAGKGDCVTTYACEGIDDDCLFFRDGLSYVCCDLAWEL